MGDCLLHPKKASRVIRTNLTMAGLCLPALASLLAPYGHHTPGPLDPIDVTELWGSSHKDLALG